MQYTTFGNTGLRVSVAGLGTGGFSRMGLKSGKSEDEAARLILDGTELGINVIDTAPSYGDSEMKLGRALATRRDRVVLVTKGGYGVDGTSDWTRPCLARGIDRALERLRTDHVDVFLLHSCPLETLARGDLVEELLIAKKAGKIRAVGYSGDNDALAWAAREPSIDVVETSLSPFDQAALAHIEVASARGAGILAKRPLGNAPWRFATRPERHDIATYWDRHREMNFGVHDRPFDLALRFSAHAPGVVAALVGTGDIAHLERASASVERGPLPPDVSREIARAFAAKGRSWPGVI
jgi:aryl-alcohol dehydrogenase-like predicted oxidoreductase